MPSSAGSTSTSRRASWTTGRSRPRIPANGYARLVSFVLFSGSNDRAVHALARVMRACGERFVVIARKGRDRARSSFLRHHLAAARTGDVLEPAAFEALLKSARLPDDGDGTRVLVPSSEYLNLFLVGLDRERLRRETGCTIPLVERELYHRLTHKESSTRLFAGAGFRVPAVLDGFDPGALPLVAKPRTNHGPDGLLQYPVLIETRADLDAFLARGASERYFPQEFVRGDSRYLLAYVSRGGEIYASSQRNLAQQPGGKSVVLAETSDFHESEVARRAVELLKRVAFHGFAMIEFIVDAAGPCYIEVNPRPWGPLQLCADHACGIIEAFLGDYAHDDPSRYRALWQRKPRHARYMWIGGMIETFGSGRRTAWNPTFTGSRAAAIGRSLGGDVYLRRDTLGVFLGEAIGR